MMSAKAEANRRAAQAAARSATNRRRGAARPAGCAPGRPQAAAAVSVLCAVALGLAGCGGEAPAGKAARVLPAGSYAAHTVKDPQQSAAFLAVDDLEGDGQAEIILSTLIEQSPPGPPSPLSRGALRVFRSAHGPAGPWDEQVLISTTDIDGHPFINTPQVMDIDEDGIKDILVQTGFLTTLGGAQFWLEGPDFMARHNFAPETTRYMTGYFWHEAAQVDLDGDGRLDIVTTSAQTQDLVNNPTNPTGSPDGNEKLRVEWHRHLGGGEFDYRIIDEGVGGVFIKSHDVDRDGDPDILLTQFFGPLAEPSVLWLEMVERPAPGNEYTGVWERHTIDSTIGLGFHMEIADIDHDGAEELIVDSHNHQDDPRMVDESGEVILPGIYWFEFPDDPRAVEQWPKTTVSQTFRVTLAGSPQSQGTPGIFDVGDVDGNGRLDLVVPSDGSDTLYVFRQRADGSFLEEQVVTGEKMIAMAVAADLDGDGRDEIIAAKHNSNDGGYTLPPGWLKIFEFVAD